MNRLIKLVIGLFILFLSLITPISADTSDSTSTTQSEQDITLNHVIQIDSVQLYPKDYLLVQEYLYFNNIGTKKYNGLLRTWFPNGAEEIKISKINDEGLLEPLQIVHNENIISWQDSIETNKPSKYKLEYMLIGNETLTYSKNFIYPPLINKIPNKITLIVTRRLGDYINITDEKKNNISHLGNPRNSEDYFFYNWDEPKFKGLNVDLRPIDRLDISAEVTSYSGNPINEIYVGSLIYYNITVHNSNKYEIERRFNVTISDSNGGIIHNLIWDTGIMYPNKSKSFLPYLLDKRNFYYISPLKSDTYILEVSNIDEPIIFYENKTIGDHYFYRFKINNIEFPFPVASQYEKRLKEINEKQFNQNIELSDILLKLTVIMLIVSIIQLIVQLKTKR